MFLHYQKLHLKCFEHMCEMYFWTVFCCLHVCVLHLFCTDYQALYWDLCSFTHTVHFFIYKCLYGMPLFLSHCHHTILPSHHTAITPYCHHTTLPSHHTAILPYWHHSILSSHHTAITPYCHHTTLTSHHTTITPHCNFTILTSHHTSITPHCHHTTLPCLNTLRTGHLNCLNACSRGLNHWNQLLYCVSLKIYNKFANYFFELKFSGNTHQRPW